MERRRLPVSCPPRTILAQGPRRGQAASLHSRVFAYDCKMRDSNYSGLAREQDEGEASSLRRGESRASPRLSPPLASVSPSWTRTWKRAKATSSFALTLPPL
ncbi:MAG TPA: hypothetical protein VN729_08670 [Ktedonobacteraceae bacterium]|nr:hypothetical protein [Ktedonobacteraceae bacterium]